MENEQVSEYTQELQPSLPARSHNRILFFGLAFGLLVLFLTFFLTLPKGTKPQPRYISKGTEIGQIEFPQLRNQRVFLETVAGEYVIQETKYTSTQNEPRLGSVNEWLHETPQYTLFETEDKLAKYNKETKKLEFLEYPLEVTNEFLGDDTTTVGVFVLSVDNTFAIVNFYTSDINYQTYLLNLTTNTYARVSGLEGNCTITYCGMPFRAHRWHDEHIVVIQGGGDACWSQGVLSAVDTYTQEVTELTKYSTGCRDDNEEYIGLIPNVGIFMAKHTYAAPKSPNISASIYSSLSIVDPHTGDRGTLLDSSQMPDGITSVVKDSNDNYIYLVKEPSRGYTYDIKNKAVSEEQSLPEFDPKTQASIWHWEAEPVYQIASEELSFGKPVSAKLTDRTENKQKIILIDSAGNELEYFTNEHWLVMYKNHIQYEDDKQECLTWTRFVLTDVMLQNNILQVKLNTIPPSETAFNCRVLPQAQTYMSEIDLTTGKVYLL